VARAAVQSGLPSVQGDGGRDEGRITEIPPGGTLPPMQFALGETVYVLDGQGLTTVSSGNGPKRTFEWQTHSMFHLPRYSWRQLSNARAISRHGCSITTTCRSR